MAAYYNEFHPPAAAMLRQLIKDGLIADGEVDERSIKEVTADELKGFTQCHFFAGIGGWPVALRLAMWPDDRPVWTGSCPCQPFSSAGKQKGKKDERHLLPIWLNLIRECRPAIIFGEQVASAVAHGWLDDVYQGLEEQNYAVGAAVLPACSVGAPHKRDRLWFVGNAQHDGHAAAAQCGGDGAPVSNHPQGQNSAIEFTRTGAAEHVANAGGKRLERHRELEQQPISEGWQRKEGHPWTDGALFDCPDGKARLIEPSICLLAHGVQHRAPILHAFGNAIVPQVAAEFIKATM